MKPKIKRKWNQSPHCLFLKIIFKGFYRQQGKSGGVSERCIIFYFRSCIRWKPVDCVSGQQLTDLLIMDSHWLHAGHQRYRNHAAGCCSHTCRFKCFGKHFFLFQPAVFFVKWKKKQILKELWCQFEQRPNHAWVSTVQTSHKCDWIWKMGTSDVDEAAAVNVFTVRVAATLNFTLGYESD